MTLAGRLLAFSLLAAAGGAACHSESDLLTGPDGGGRGGSAGNGGTGGAAGGGAGGTIGGGGGRGGSAGGGGGGAAGGGAGGTIAGGGGTGGTVGGGGGTGGSVGGRGGGSGGTVGGGGGGTGGTMAGRGGTGGATGGAGGGTGGTIGGRGGTGGSSGGGSSGGQSCVPVGGGGGSARGGSGGGGGTPPAPSHARTTAPGFPPGRWVDRMPCRIPYVWPPALSYARAAFDSDRRRVVVMGLRRGLEVWELDPTTGAWQDRTPCPLPASWPTTEANFLLGYDRSRRKTVMFDGGETWEWDGQAGTWELRATGGLPLYGSLEAPITGVTVLEYDPQRRTMVLPGRDLYDWDGAVGTWTERWRVPVTGSPQIPSDVYRPVAFAYDPDRSVLMLFGGGGFSPFDHELWETDGVQWTNRTPLNLPASWPSGRNAALLFYEPNTRKMILASGWSEEAARDDLWAFDSTTGAFTAAPPASPGWSPSGAGFAATAGNGRVMVFDSVINADHFFGHALSWDVAAGQPAIDLRPAHVPVAWPLYDQGQFAAAYDARRGRVVMFGGWGDGMTSGTSANLLEWNGEAGTWQDRTVARNCQTPWPPSRRSFAMAADSRRGLILMFGGDQLIPDNGFGPAYLGPRLADYWEWDGQAGTFTQRLPASAGAAWPPANPALEAAAMSYDEARDRVVLVHTGNGDPWEWDPVAGTWTPPPTFGNTNVGGASSLLYRPGDATTLAVGGPIGGATRITSWDPIARAWNVRLDFDSSSPHWITESSAAIDPISGVVWKSGDPLFSWQAGGTAWTNRSSIALPPVGFDTVLNGALVFDERRGTLVLLLWTAFSFQADFGIGVWELAVP